MLMAVFFIPCAATIAQEEPIVHYSFDEGAGDVLHDRSGNDAHGKITGATWVRNGGRWALEFDGVDDFVNCGALNVIGPQTLAAWIYVEPLNYVGPDSSWQVIPILGNGNCQILQRAHDSANGSTSPRSGMENTVVCTWMACW